MVRRIWLALAVTAACLLLLVLPAAGASYEFTSGFTESGIAVWELPAYLPSPVERFSGRWEFSGDCSDSSIIKIDGTDGISMLQASLPEEEITGYMSFHCLRRMNLEEGSTLSFGIFAADSQDSISPDDAGLPAGLYKVITTVQAGSVTRTSEVYIAGNNWTVVHVELPAAVKLDLTTSLEIRIEYDPGTPPQQVRLTHLSLTDRNCRYISAFSAEAFTSAAGSVEPMSNWLKLTPDETGSVVMEASVTEPRYVFPTATRYLSVTAADTLEGGTLSVGALYTGSDVWQESGTLEICRGTHTYLFPLPAALTDDSGQTGYTFTDGTSLEAYRLSFRNAAGENEYIRITGVELLDSAVPQWTDSGLGSVTEATVRDGMVIYNGKLTRDAVIDYIDGSVELLAVPLWNPYTLDEAISLGTVRVSNSFTFEIPLDTIRSHGQGWLYCAVITLDQTQDDADGAADETGSPLSGKTVLPITRPQMLDGIEPEPCTLSLFGFHEASAVGVYESNVSHVTVDVMLDELILTDGTAGVVTSLGGMSYHLSSAVLSQLDSEILFYTNAGLEVSLRFCSASPFAYSDMTAENYLPLPEGKEAMMRYGAVLAYLCRRYPDISSVTLGMGVNCEKYTGLSLDDPAALMDRIAALTALTYQIARTAVPDVYVVLPLADGHVYESEDALPDSGQVLDPERALILFADALEEYGDIPYVLSYRFESDSAADTAAAGSLPDHLKQVLYQHKLPVFCDLIYFWEPEACLKNEPAPYNLAKRYQMLAYNLSQNDPRAVVLSLSRIADYVSQTMYADVQEIPDPDDTALREVHPFTARLLEGDRTLTDCTGTAVLWDFTDLYHTDGFVSGGGIRSLHTSVSPLFSGDNTFRRVLRSEIPVSLYEDSMAGNAGGILLRNFSASMDLSAVDSLTFTFSVEQTGPSSYPVKLVFLVGAEDWRAEYHVDNVTPGQIMTAVCDLTGYEYAGQTEYIGVMLYAQSSLTFDLSSVRAFSSECTDEELNELFRPTPAADEPHGRFVEMFYIVLILTILSVSVFIMILRRDREEEGEIHAKRKT